MDITLPANRPSDRSVLHSNELAVSYAAAMSHYAVLARMDAFGLQRLVAAADSRPDWELRCHAEMVAAERRMTETLTILREAIATFEALPVGASYLEAAE